MGRIARLLGRIGRVFGLGDDATAEPEAGAATADYECSICGTPVADPEDACSLCGSTDTDPVDADGGGAVEDDADGGGAVGDDADGGGADVGTADAGALDPDRARTASVPDGEDAPEERLSELRAAGTGLLERHDDRWRADDGGYLVERRDGSETRVDARAGVRRVLLAEYGTDDDPAQ